MGSLRRDRLPDPLTYFIDQGLSLTAKGRWRTTRCVFHGGSDSMRINTANGAWICMSCGVKGGDVLAYHMCAHELDFVGAAKALGAWDEVGSPAGRQAPTPLPARAALDVLQQESTLTAVAACNVGNGVVLPEQDRARLLLAAGRIHRIVEVFRG